MAASADPGNFSCGVYPVNIVGPPCSGNGACVFSPEYNRGICVCNPGWHGESDLRVTTSLTDCHISRNALIGVWAFYLLVQLVFGYLALPKLHWLFKRHREQIIKAREKGRTYSFFHNKPLVAWMPYFALGYFAQLVYSITMLATLTDWNLGRDALLSAMYIIWRVTFYVALFVFQANFLASLLKAERSLDGVIRKNFIMSYTVMTAICLASIFILVPQVVADIDPFDPYLANVAGFFGACALCFLFVSAQAIYILRKVIKILDRAQHHLNDGDSKSKRLRDKIVKFQILSRNTAILQFIIYGLFCAFPYMWNKHDYLLPISWLAVLRTMMEGLNSLVDKERENESTSAKTGGSSQGANRKRSSLIETIKQRMRSASNANAVEDAGANINAPPHLFAVKEAEEEEKGMFEQTMQRATLGKGAIEHKQIPAWAAEQESISRDIITAVQPPPTPTHT